MSYGGPPSAPAPYGAAYGWAAGPGAYIPDPPGRGQQIAAWITAAACAALAGLLLVVALIGFGMHAYMKSVAVAAPATVVDVDDEFGFVYVDFDVRGETWEEVEVPWSDPYPDVGDVVTVEYDPDDPEYVQQPGSREDAVWATWLAVAGGVLLLPAAGATVWAVSAGRSRRRRMDAWRAMVAGRVTPPQPPYAYAQPAAAQPHVHFPVPDPPRAREHPAPGSGGFAHPG